MDSDSTSPAPSTPWIGDHLFRDDLPDWRNNAVLYAAWGRDQVGYAEGYRRGARILAEHAENNHCDKDFLVYPIIFLYRHHIELTLKNIMQRTPVVIKRPLTNPETAHLKKHRLDIVWNDLKPLLAAICKAVNWQSLDPADVKGIDDYIEQLSTVDRDSFSFRYALSKEGQRLIPLDLKAVNIRHFADALDRLANYLVRIDAATEHLEEITTEWQRDGGGIAAMI